MRVLVACEFSGVVRDAFGARGHDAWSCDIESCEVGGRHIRDDVLRHLDDGWDLMIAHPPCTRLCLSGVRWLHERNLWQEMREAAAFFVALRDARIPRRAIENPQPHKYATALIGPYQQAIQPYDFDEPFTKRTCLWLRGLPPLFASVICEERKAACHRAAPSPTRSAERARTYSGIAKAMAQQWG